MQVPLELAFRNMDTPEWAEAEIRERVGRLERIFDRLTACRVWVEAPPAHTKRDMVPTVRIEMSVPGQKLAVSHEPNKAHEDYHTPDLGVAIREAFTSAERRLKDYKKKHFPH